MTFATNTFAGSNFSASDTVSGIPIGAAFPGRVVVLAFVSNPSLGLTATIGGVPASIFETVDGSVIAAAVVSAGTTTFLIVNGGTEIEVLGAWSLTGYPSTVVQAAFFIQDTGAGHSIGIGDQQCAVGWTVGVSNVPGPTGSFNGLNNDGAGFSTNAAGPFAAAHPARVGSINKGAAGTPTITVSGFTSPWFLVVACFGGGGTPPDTLMGQILME